MRLHLPKALLAAVLAACLAWPAGATGYTASCNNNGTEIKCSSDGGTTKVALTVPTTGDTLTFDVSAGYLFDARSGTAEEHTIAANLVITQLKMTNGYSGGGTTAWYYFTGSVSGSGEITRTSAQNSLGFSFSGDMSEYSGNITINGGGGTPAEGRDYDNILKLGAIQVGKSGAAGSITINDNSKLQLAGTTIWGNVTSVKTEIGQGNTTFRGNLTNNGTLTNDGTVSIYGTFNGNTITQSSNAKLTLESGAIVNLDSLTSAFNLSNAGTSGLQTYSKTWTLASGGAVDDKGATYKFSSSALTGSMTDGVFSTESVYNCYNIASGITQTYTEVTTAIGTNTVDFINVLGELSELSGSIATEIRGSGTLSMSAGAGEATIAADKLTGFTGDLVIHSGRFKEVQNGHVFSNVTVEDGGQFYLAGNGSYSGSVSIAGTGWDASNDTAKAGALRIGLGATLSGPLTLTDDAVILVLSDNAQGTPRATITGNLNLNGHTLTVKGSTGGLLFGTGVTIGSGEGMVNIVADEALIGVNEGGSLSILKDFTGKGLCSTGTGTITIGNGTDKVVTSVERIELGDTNTAANTTTLTVKANSILKITGTDNNGTNYKTVSALLGEWNARTTATINGTLLSEAAALQAGDTGYTLNIGSTGLVTAKGIQRAKSTNATIAVNLNGGSLILGETGIKAAGVTSTSTGGVIGSYADTTTIASGLSLTSGTTTIDTSKYTINTDNTVTVGENATGSTITINGIISGSGTLKVSGGGILVLNGNNTYTNETRLSGGEIQAGNANAFGTGKLIVDGDSSISGTATIADFIDVSNNATLTIKGGSAITLSNSTANKGMWIASGSSVALESGASITGYNVTVSYLNANSELAAEGADGGQFGTCGHNHENAITIKESAISLANGAVLRNKLDGGTVSSTGNTKIGWLENNSTYGGGSISSLEVTSGTLDVASVLAVTKSATIAGTLSIGEKATTAINSEREDGTASTIATLTGSGTLKATGGTTEATNASGFTGTLDAAGGNITASGGIASLTAVKATGGNITLQGAANLALTEVVVSSGKTILAFTEDSNYVNFSAQNVRVGEGGGSLIGNLSINNNGTLTLNAVDGTSGTGLSLSYPISTLADVGPTSTSGSLTLGSGLTLNLLNLDLKQGQSLTLFSEVTGVTGIDDMVALKSGSLEANTVFTNLTAGDFNLSFDETSHIVALVAQRDVPEPTTATLSLLALMGLAARRRRRKA